MIEHYEACPADTSNGMCECAELAAELTAERDYDIMVEEGLFGGDGA